MQTPEPRTSASQGRWLLVALPMIAISLIMGWAGQHYLGAKFETEPSIEKTREQINTLKAIDRIAEGTELRHELAAFYRQLGELLEDGGPAEAQEASEAFLQAEKNRPNIGGGWVLLDAARLLEKAGADPQKIKATYLTVSQKPDVALSLQALNHLAAYLLGLNDPLGYGYADTVSRYGHWTEECRNAVLNGPESETAAALWCRALALLEPDGPVQYEARMLLEQYHKLHPWDDAALYYLGSEQPAESELDLRRMYPSPELNPDGSAVLEPGKAKRVVVYANRNAKLQFDCAAAEQTPKLQISLNGKVQNANIEARQDIGFDIEPGHHVVELKIPGTEAEGIVINSIRLIPKES